MVKLRKKRETLNEGVVDLALVYSFVRRLATPFERWPAFSFGIIDKDGNILRPRKTLDRREERAAFGLFDVLVLNLKKLLARLPGGGTQIASYSAALFLLKEHSAFTNGSTLAESIKSEADIEQLLIEFLRSYEVSPLTRGFCQPTKVVKKSYQQILAESKACHGEIPS